MYMVTMMPRGWGIGSIVADFYGPPILSGSEDAIYQKGNPACPSGHQQPP